eukprot:11804878-Heterocapsa_arctica.AAC.1
MPKPHVARDAHEAASAHGSATADPRVVPRRRPVAPAQAAPGFRRQARAEGFELVAPPMRVSDDVSQCLVERAAGAKLHSEPPGRIVVEAPYDVE